MLLRTIIALMLVTLPVAAQQLPPAYQSLLETYQMLLGRRDYEIEGYRSAVNDYDSRLKWVLDNWVPKDASAAPKPK